MERSARARLGLEEREFGSGIAQRRVGSSSHEVTSRITFMVFRESASACITRAPAHARFRRKLLVTTETLENAIASEANTGESR